MNIDSDLESMSTLLIVTCTLQGVRLSQFRDTQVHWQLYEHVRAVLASVLLISPLPMDCLYALAIMSLWNMAPNMDVNVPLAPFDWHILISTPLAQSTQKDRIH